MKEASQKATIALSALGEKKQQLLITHVFMRTAAPGSLVSALHLRTALPMRYVYSVFMDV